MLKLLLVRLILVTFFFTSVGPSPDIFAQSVIDLPAPGMMVNRSYSFEPLELKGILVNIRNPLSFDFLVDKGDSGLYGQALKAEITRLAKYFLTCLTVPENDLWVNLSPYEKDRIVTNNFGITLMGKDLLEQDYLLKQIMASLSYPENDLGKRFWQRVYKRAYELYGTTEIPINTFNKVWILPKTADVYVVGNSAFVVNSKLDVMLEADYKSYVHHLYNGYWDNNGQGMSQNVGAYSQVFRDVILPELRNEVNEGKNFAIVRQVYNAMILAAWYKRHLKDSLLGRMYVGRNEVSGVDIVDKNAKEKIFQQYLKAYKKCVYNYIKEDFDPLTNQTVARKYASGGMYFAGFGGPDSKVFHEVPNPKGMKIGSDLAMATVDVSATNINGKIISFPDMRAKITDTNPFHQVPLEARKGMISKEKRNITLNDQAMTVPRLFRPLILAFVLAVGGLGMTPVASAATKTTLDDQIVLREQKLAKEEAYFKIDNSNMHGGERLIRLSEISHDKGIVKELLKEKAQLREKKDIQKVSNPAPAVLQNQDNSKPQQTPLLQKNIRSEYLPLDEHIVSSTKIIVHGPTESPGITNVSLKSPLITSKAHSVLSSFPLISVSSISVQLSTNFPFQLNSPIAITFTKSSVSNGFSSGGAPPPPEDLYSDILQNLKDFWPWYTGISILGIGGGFLSKYNSRKSKILKVKDVPIKTNEINASAPIANLPSNLSNFFDVTLLPPPASAGESNILVDDLTKLRAVASGSAPAPGPIPAEDDSQSGGQNLSWMHLGSLLGAMGLGWYLNGGISWVLGLTPLMTAGFYVTQKWFHEKFHLAFAAILYHPKNLGTTLSERNLKGNFLSQLSKSIRNFYRTPRSYVDLPFAKAEGGWWNKFRNRVVGISGFAGSAALTLMAAHLIGFTPLLAPLLLSAAAVLKGSIDSGDLTGSEDTDEGKFGCGIIGFMKRVPLQGVYKKDMKTWLTWFFNGVENSTARGGQQAGVSSNYSGQTKTFEQIDKKETKEKRNLKLWRAWDWGPVFFGNMINDLYDRFYRTLPRKLVPVYNYVQFGVLKFLAHVRFATNGDMVDDAAHPHSSPEEKREQWVFDSVQNKYRKVNRVFNVTSAFNGDHDNTRFGFPSSSRLFNTMMGTGQMRWFFSAAVHKYYNKRVTVRYLKRTVSDGLKYKQKVTTDYEALLRALRKKGYIDFEGYVSRRFVKLDDEFKSWFPDYKQEVFAEIGSALFGIPPGDAPILPLQQHLDLTEGSWFASLRYAHVMLNHDDINETSDDILFEKEGRAVGRVFSEVYDQVEPFLSRRGYKPNDPEKLRTLNDLYVQDEQTAKKLGLEGQYEMIQIFKKMLYQRMQNESGQNTLAGNVFKKWEQGWKKQGRDVEKMRQMIINTSVEKFFTADNVAATKEFAERADGSYGVFMQNPLDNSITLYQDNQDVAIGYNQSAGIIAFGSDPRALKSVGPHGEKVEKVMHLKDGEVVNVSFSPSGRVVIRSWIKVQGKWIESTKEELAQRTYPTSEYTEDGLKNEYYAPPPVQYASPRTVVQEDLQNTPKILARAQTELDDPDSFNRQSTEYLASRISDTIKKKGKSRLVLIGYDNSHKLSEQFKKITGNLFDESRLIIDVIDANEFDDSPLKYKVQPDDIVMIVSKSGATFSSKLAMRIIKKLVYRENIFCMTARIDSVLNTMLGQGLRPGKDKFTKRIFITGEFYPSESPVVSEVLLEFQLQQLAVNLARTLGRMNDPKISMALNIPPERLERIAPTITKYSLRLAQDSIGFDLNGKKYANTNKEPKDLGNYLGKAALETFYMNWIQRLFVAGVLSTPLLLFGQYIGGGLLGTALNVVWITNVFPFLATELYRKAMGRPAYGRDSPFALFIAAPPIIASTQRNFLSRVLTNRLGSIGPRAIYGGDPTTNFVADYASDQVRGDINLRFALKHRANEGRMGVGQATYPQTAIFGTNVFRGRPEKFDVIVEVPHDVDATDNEIDLLDNTVGFLGLMIDAKTIGVEMAKVASFNGRLYDLAYTFSSAGVHTTQINPIKEEAKQILNSGNDEILNQSGEAQFADYAQVTSRDGGIDMNSGLMRLKISGYDKNRISIEDNAISGVPLKGVVPQVSGIITVTPDMLKTMLGTGYFN